MGASGKMVRLRRNPVNDTERNIDIRGAFRVERAKLYFGCGVRKRDYLGVNKILTENAQKRLTGKRRFYADFRLVTRTVKVLVGGKRHGRGISERCSHRLIPPIARVKGRTVFNLAVRIGDFKLIIAAGQCGQFKESVAISLCRDLKIFRDGCAHAFALPRRNRSARFIRINVVDSDQCRSEILRLAETLAVGSDAGDGHFDYAVFGKFHPVFKSRSDIIRIIMQYRRVSRSRRATAVLENGTLYDGADCGCGKAGILKERRENLSLAAAVESRLVEHAEVRLKRAVRVAETPTLPIGGCERRIFKNDRAVAHEACGGTAVKMFR